MIKGKLLGEIITSLILFVIASILIYGTYTETGIFTSISVSFCFIFITFLIRWRR